MKVYQATSRRIGQDAQRSDHAEAATFCDLTRAKIIEQHQVGVEVFSQEDSFTLPSFNLLHFKTCRKGYFTNTYPFGSVENPMANNLWSSRFEQFVEDGLGYYDNLI